MKVYVGQGNMRYGCAMAKRLRNHGIGVCVCPGELPAIHEPWFFDNGAFRAWRNGRSFPSMHFHSELDKIRRMKWSPEFVVAPDEVAAGMRSLERSLRWLPFLGGIGPIFLAVQDGMHLVKVAQELEKFDGIFVGGTVGWKVRNGSRYVDLAHKFGKKCHIGRVGTPKRVKWARAIGADSIDSSFPLWTKDRLEEFAEACFK